MRPVWLLKVVVSLAALGGLLLVVPLDELVESIRSLPLAVVASVLAVFLVGHVAAASKWWLLMGGGEQIRFRACLEAHFAGLLSNLYLPGVAGGDLIRAGWLMRGPHSKESVAVASVADRLIDLLALVVLASSGAVFLGRLREREGWLVGITALVVLGLALTAVATLWVLERRGVAVAQRVRGAVDSLRRHPRRLLSALTLSLGVQISFVGLNLWLGLWAGVRPGFAAWLLAWPLAKLVAAIPVSIAGIGVREIALVALLEPLGVAPAAATAVGLAWEVVLVAGAIFGWIATQTLARAEARSR